MNILKSIKRYLYEPKYQRAIRREQKLLQKAVDKCNQCTPADGLCKKHLAEQVKLTQFVNDISNSPLY